MAVGDKIKWEDLIIKKHRQGHIDRNSLLNSIVQKLPRFLR